MFKRVLSMVLVLVTLVSVLPPRAEAENVQPQVENSVTMEGTNSFGNLLANTMNESPEAQTEGEDNRVCDLVIEGTTATVEYTTTKNAKVVVAVYTEDGTKMLGSGTAEVTPEETAVVVEIQISPMPKYYSAGAYLLDAKTNDPLSPVFRTQLYTKAVQDIKNSTVEDYDPEKVLNLDEDNTTNFAVFGDRTILVREDSPVQITGGDGVYTVSNADERFLGMVAGDSFAQMQEDGEVLIVKAAEVKVEGNTVTVWEDENASLLDVFDAIKIEAVADQNDTEYDDTTVDSRLSVVDEADFFEQDDDVEQYALDEVRETSFEKSFKTKGNMIRGSLTLKGTSKVVVYSSFTYDYISVKTSFSITGAITVSGKNEFQMPLSTIMLKFAGFCTMRLTPKFYYTASMSLTYNIKWETSVGWAYDSDVGEWQNIGTPSSVKRSMEASGKIFIGLGGELALSVVTEKVIYVGVEFQAGVEASAKYKTEALSSKSTSSVHVCNLCLDGELDAVLKIKISFAIGPVKDKLPEWTFKWRLTPFYYCADKDEGGFYECPHREYRLKVTTKYAGDVPAGDAALRLLNADGVEIPKVTLLDDKDEVYTAAPRPSDENGLSVLYLPQGEYTLEVSKDGIMYTKQITIQGHDKALTIPMKEPTGGLTFTLTEDNVEMDLFEQKQITAIFGWSTASNNVTSACQWTSSNEKVVRVQNGNLIPNEPGTAVITAKYRKQDYTYFQTVDVVVKGGNITASGTCGENLKWCLDEEGTLTIWGTGEMENFLKHKPWKAPWADLHPKKLVLGEGITTISEGAFGYCTELTGQLILPNSLTKIGSHAFIQCAGFTGDLVIPENVREIGRYAFQGCTGFDGQLVLPSELTEISESCFSMCSRLQGDLVIPEHVKRIKACAFGSDDGFTGSLRIPNSVEAIEISAFNGCDGLTGDLIIGDSVTYIGDHAFSAFSGTLKLPDCLEEIDDGAFEDCRFTNEIVLPKHLRVLGKFVFSHVAIKPDMSYMEDLQSVGWAAFFCCTFSGDLILPDNLKNIGKEAFASCSGIERLVLPKNIEVITEDAFAFSHTRMKGDLIIPEGVRIIEHHAFGQSQFEGRLQLPSTIETIESRAFWGCDFSGDLILPTGIKVISDAAFYKGGFDGKLVIPEGVDTIKMFTFAYTKLKSAYVPLSVRSIEECAFDGATDLEDIWYAGTAMQWAEIAINQQQNAPLLSATIHFSDGTTSQTSSLDTPEVPDPTETMEETEPTEETIPETTEEITPETTEESIEETTEETTAYPEGTYIAPEGGDLVETPVLEEMSMYTGKETVKNGLRTVAFVGLEPGEEYVLIVSLRPGSVASADLQYIEQAAASAEGKVRFTYIPRTDVSAIPQLYGISAQREIKLDREYLTMPLDALSEPLTATVTPEEWADEVTWSSEDENILTVDSKGYVTPVAVGTGYAVATVRHGKYVLSARCRVDVTEQKPNEEVLGIDLTSPKVTTDLYSTDYTQIDILPRLPQNEVAAFAAAPEDNGAAITGAYLEDETARALFDLRVKDDRTLLVVPTQAAIEGAKGVKSSYSSKLAVSVNGVEYHTAEAVTIGVKKTLPKLKAGKLTFNPFYTGQSQALNMTGGTVTKIEGTVPDWLELDGTRLTLKNAPKSGSASVNLLVYTEEWAVPVSVKVNVKLSYKAPAVKLSASSVSLSDSESKGTTLKLSAGKKTLEALGGQGSQEQL